MEEKINIAEILNDKPQGTKLYDWLHNIDVELDTIGTTDTETVVWCTNETNNNTTCHRGYSEFGTERGYPDGLQILFPSKKIRDWEKFSWKKGDLLINSCGFQCIFKEWSSDDYTKFNGCYSNSRDGYEDVSNADTAKFVKLDNNTAYGYVREIERKLGGILNLETLEIEKDQPEFKDGDIVVYGKSVAICRKICKHTLFPYVSIDETSRLLFNDNPNVSPDECMFATEEEKKQLFSALENEGKAWDSEKKAIVNLKQEVELKPFDKVLVRDGKYEIWEPAFFFRYLSQFSGYNYQTVGGEWRVYCIPYIGNESLLGTTKDMEG